MKYLAIGAALIVSQPAEAAPLHCKISQKWFCDEGQPCRPIPALTWNTYDRATHAYQRCDRQGCDTYDTQTSTSGIWLNVAAPTRGIMARLASDGTFLEVVTQNTGVYVSHGRCR